MSALDTLRRWLHYPIEFVRENFQVEPDRWQAQVLMEYAQPGKTRHAMQACAGPGKSAVLSWCGWHFLATQSEQHHHPNGYAVSITKDNLTDNLWKEFAVWRDRSTFLQREFVWTAEKVYHRSHPGTWWIKARAFKQTADAEAKGRTLSGLHAKRIIYLLDEAGDMPPQLVRAANQGLTNCEVGKIMLAGNPTSLEGALYHVVTNEASRWHVVRITGDPDDKKRSSRIDIEEARENIRLYGRDNPWVKAFVLGLFPPSSINALLGPDEVRESMQRRLADHVYANIQKRLGIDVSRFGDDRTVLFPRQGRRAFNPVIMRNQRSPAIAARIALAKHNWRSEMEFIDDTGGWGGGTIDQCLLGGIALIPLNMAGDSPDPRYFNMRSYLDFKAADWVKGGGWLPDVPGLVTEATAATYWFHEGKLRVEEKEQIKSRIGHSPDLWDAFKETFALPDMPASVEALIGTGATRRSSRLLTDWDPLEGV